MYVGIYISTNQVFCKPKQNKTKPRQYFVSFIQGKYLFIPAPIFIKIPDNIGQGVPVFTTNAADVWFNYEK